MLLLLLLLGDKKAKVQFEIELTSVEKDGNFDFQELTEFLQQLNYIHNRAIRLTQQEYQGREFDEADILDYHKLNIEQITKNSPLKLLISFTIDVDYLVPYISILKIFFKLCKKYGATTNHLENTLNSIRNTLFSALMKYNVLKISSNNEINEDSFYSKLMRLMDDEKFRKAYNSFCKTGITISKFISITTYFENENIVDDDFLH